MGMQPEFFRHSLQQFLFDGQRGLARGQSGAIGDAEEVCVDCDRRFAEGDVQHDIRGFPAYTRQLFQRSTIMRYRSCMFIDQDFAGGNDVFGFGAVQADALDMCLKSRHAKIE